VTQRARARKLADRIRVVVAEMLEMRVKDPRLGFITITDARVTNDLREATLFYTVYGSDAERADTAAALESAKGVLRTEVGRQTGVRFTPSLTFVQDAIPDTARHIDELLTKAQTADARVRANAVGAQYAGGADPYRAEANGDPADADASPADGAHGDADLGDCGDRSTAPDAVRPDPVHPEPVRSDPARPDPARPDPARPDPAE
jgi:ribosome-binding factor A